MRDVAARAGVSRSLVSTVFRGVPGAGPATRERVLAAAAELGYRPDDRARGLRSRSRRVVGVTLTAVHPFHVALTEALHVDADVHGYQLSLSWTTGHRSLARAVDMLLAQRCTALIHIGPTVTVEELGHLAELADPVPTIVVDRYVDLPTIDALRVDDAAGIRLTVQHLFELGHREIWYTDGSEYVSAPPRLAGYLAAMDAYGLGDRTRVLPSGGTRADGATTALALLASGSLPTALVAYNDQSAFGLIDVLVRHGVRVPEDISIVGFDNDAEAGMPHLALTTVEQRADLLAVATCDVTRSRLDGAASGGLHLQPPGPLILRSTTGPPRPDAL